jgi:Flp pilus assembly pilin Flp
MKTLLCKLVRFIADEAGPTAVEYATIILLVFLIGLSVVVMIGQSTGRNANAPNTQVETVNQVR